MATDSDHEGGGTPPRVGPKRRRRSLSGPGAAALLDLHLILLILASDLDGEAAKNLRANINAWGRMYLNVPK